MAAVNGIFGKVTSWGTASSFESDLVIAKGLGATFELTLNADNFDVREREQRDRELINAINSLNDSVRTLTATSQQVTYSNNAIYGEVVRISGNIGR